MTKICSICKVEKDISEFSPNGKTKKGIQIYRAQCRHCVTTGPTQAKFRSNRRETRLTEREQTRDKCVVCNKILWITNKIGYCKEHRGESPVVKQKEKEYRTENFEQIKAQRANKPEEVKQANRDQAAKLRRESRKDPKVGIDHRMSVNIYQALKGNKAGRKWEDLVGFSLNELIVHLKKHLLNGMTKEMFSMGIIHIDHVIPKSHFQYKTDQDEGFKKCWALDNLRPLWSEINEKKWKNQDFDTLEAIRIFELDLENNIEQLKSNAFERKIKKQKSLDKKKKI